MRKLLCALLGLILTLPVFAACPSGQVEQTYTSATGTVVQNGTPTPANPITPTFYTQGNMVLRKVGDYADSYDATTGKITRRVGVKVLNGTEEWILNTNNNNSSVYSDNTITNRQIGVNGISTHFASNQSTTTYGGSFYGVSSQRINFSIVDIATDVPTWKSWLSSHPVTVYYPLATETTENWNETTYCANQIKIATTAYNSARFSPVVTELNDTIATIRDVVTNTINQTAAIADLQTIKQTRPADDYTDETNTENCPKFRQCLLVEDDNGTPHWYLIKDPVRDLVKSLRDNKINNAGETTTTAYAANGYDGTNGTVDSRYYRGYVAMRKLADGSTSVSIRQFGAALTGGDNGGQYKTLSDQEWAVTWNGNETGTAGSFLPGVIYGISRCSKVKPSSTAVGTEGWTTIENSDPVNDAENIQSYVQCYCKMTGVGIDGEITPVKNSSRAPWVFYSTSSSAALCARICASACANSVLGIASFRQRIMDWAVE